MFKKSQKKSRNKGEQIGDVVLPNAKLRFCAEQLQNLNYMFLKRVQEKTAEASNDKSLLLARSVTERLVQRLICCAGIIDPRFASKFLISNHDQVSQNIPTSNLEYIIRLDSLSTPRIYDSDPQNPKYSVIENDPDYPAGYARIRFHNHSKKWGDCSNPSGYLRRDKVQARLVELLAQAATSDLPDSPLSIDESIYCGIPGKIVDASTLNRILKISSEQHVFYGPGGNVPRFPDPRDFRLAIVDEPDGIRLKVEFLSPALCNVTIDARLLVAISVDAWPGTSDFPFRITLGHGDCLIYHQAAQTEMYLVGFGVQSSAWQIRLPAAQNTILNHHAPTSTIRTILDVLFESLEEINKIRSIKKQISYKILNRYILITKLLRKLEEDSTTPLEDLINWSPIHLSKHVLQILDSLIEELHSQTLPNYFFRKSNLLVNPGHFCEEDYETEARNVKSYLLKLFDEALMSTRGVEDFDAIVSSQHSETVLLLKWKELIDASVPPSGTRGRRFSFAGSKNRKEVAYTQYTTRQLEYIGLLLQNVLEVKQNILSSGYDEIVDATNSHQIDHLEDTIFLLVTIMDQARDQYLNLLPPTKDPNILKNRSKVRSQFNCYTSKLVDTIRNHEIHPPVESFQDDLALVKIVIKWLYKAMDHNKNYLAPILRPYLNNLFTSSHSISWQLDFIKQRLNRDEVTALGSFATLVNCGKITPAQGLIDAVNKDWNWAKGVLKMVERNTLRMVFIQDRGKVYRHIISLPSYQQNEGDNNGYKTINVVESSKSVVSTNRNYFSTILNQKFRGNFSENTPQHQILRTTSPMTLALGEFDRRGEHRGYGDILKSLQSMQKLNMFQQVTSSLPKEERTEIMELVQNLKHHTSVKPRKSTSRWSNTLPQTKHEKKLHEGYEKYTPVDESAGIRILDESQQNNGVKKIPQTVIDNLSKTGTLIGSCRAARIREDSSVFFLQDSFKIKSLMMINKSESFNK